MPAWAMPSPLRRLPGADDSPARASFVELFFDLVFVLAVTQLSSVLIEDLTVAGAAKTLFLLLAAWWAWIYTTWMTNWFDPETRPVRAILLVGMLASLFGRSRSRTRSETGRACSSSATSASS